MSRRAFSLLLCLFILSAVLTAHNYYPGSLEKLFSLVDNSKVYEHRLGRILFLKKAVTQKNAQMPHYVKLSNIAFQLQQAVVAVEDNRFYKHSGIDYAGIIRAALVNICKQEHYWKAAARSPSNW